MTSRLPPPTPTADVADPPAGGSLPAPAQLAALVLQAPQGVVLSDHVGTVQWVNPAFTTLTGFGATEVTGRHLSDVLTGAVTDSAARARMGEALAAQREFAIELENQDRRGLPYWASVQGRPTVSSDGALVGWVAYVVDITVQRQASEALRLSRERLAITMSGAGIALWDWDVDSGRVQVNDRWVELLGLSEAPPRDADAYLGRVHPDDREPASEAMRQHFAGATDMMEIELRLRQGDGTYRWVRERGRVVARHSDGTPRRVAGTTLDIDAIKRAGEQMRDATRLAEEANRAKSEFIANLSHEIRTPLNAIIGMTSLLSSTPLDATQRDYVGTITMSNRTLLDLVNDLLDFASIEAGRLELARTPYDLWATVEGVVEQFTGQAFNRGLVLACAIAHDVPRTAFGDGTRLRQVLLNLVGNAVKFTERGRVVVRLHSDAAGWLRLDVEDSGIGFDVATLPELLEPFRQADGSVTRRFGGTGLGLALVNRLVQLMGGTVSAESELGRGSRFRVLLPVEVDALAAAPAARPTARTTGRIVLAGGDDVVMAAAAETAEALGGVCVRRALGDPFTDVTPDDLLLLSERDAPRLLAALHGVRQRGVRRIGVLWSPLMDLPIEELADVVLLAMPLLPSELLLALEGRNVAAVRAARRSAATSARDEPHPAKGTVLVVEDNLANQKVTRGFLQRLGWAVDVVDNGRDAVARVQEHRYDAILMDVQMPVMNGFIATARIRKLEGSGRRTPIIAITAGASMQERARCYEAGMDDFLTKPIREDALDAALARWGTPSDEAAEALVDRAILGRMRGLPGEEGGDLVGELITMLAARVDGVVLTMRHEARQRRFEVVAREAHSMKGLSLTLGATALADRCRALEQAARDGTSAALLPLIDAFEQAWLETLPQLRAARRWLLDTDATPPATP